MSDISILGLGLMGSALARAIIGSGRDVTVWNRSAGKTEPLVKLGARAAASAVAAVEASRVTLVCVDNYPTTRALFETEQVIAALPGRIIFEMSTGTPNEARQAKQWFAGHGARYVDGAILCGTSAIGTPAAQLIYAGDREAFELCRTMLEPLGGITRFVGEDIAAAATLDLAWLSRICAEFAGIYHGAVVCQSEGVSMEQYASVFSETDSAQFWIAPLKSNDFGGATATVTVWNAAIRRIGEQARDAGISAEIPGLVSSILARAEVAGYGKERVAAMVKVLRPA